MRNNVFKCETTFMLVFLAHCSGSPTRAGIAVCLLISRDQNLKEFLTQ